MCLVLCVDDAWAYSFPSNKWEQEMMGIPRVGGDAVLLPNGDVMVVGGAMVRLTDPGWQLPGLLSLPITTVSVPAYQLSLALTQGRGFNAQPPYL